MDLALNIYQVGSGYDLVIQNNDLVLVEGDIEKIQTAKTTLQTWKGEYFADLDLGIAWQEILGEKPAPVALAVSRVRKVLNDLGVEHEIVSVSLDSDRKAVIVLRMFGREIEIFPIAVPREFENWAITFDEGW